MAYNPWYSATYEPIIRMAKWDEPCEDLEVKVIAIFSWMPQTIMKVKHEGGKYKCELFDVNSLHLALKSCSFHFYTLREKSLISENIHEWKQEIITICKYLFPIFGSVATSKYLHFSIPSFFPMWDSQIRKKAGLGDTPDGFFK